MDRTTLQYRGYTSPAGKRRIDDVLLLMGHLQNALIQHRYAANSTHRRRWSLNLQNAHLTDLHRNNAEYNSCARRLLEGTARRVNKSFSNFFNDPQNVGRPQTKSPYQNHTLEISEPASQHLKPGKHGWTTIHIKGLPTIRFRTDRRLPTENQPKVIRITKTPKRLVVSLVFDHEPKELPEPNDESVGIDPGKKWLLTAKSDDGSVLQVPGIDDAAHQKTMRQLRHKMQRQRDAAVNDGHARWVSQKSTHGTKRRFRWIDQPSKNYLEVVAQLRRVEQTRQDTMRGLQHRLSTQLVPVPGRFVDTGKSLPTVDSSLCGNDGQVKRVCSIRHIQVETVLVREHQTICMEDTKTRNLTRSAKGTAENPGKNVGQKRSLNRGILSQGWYGLRQKLEYKSRWYCRNFVPVPAHYTSQRCAKCGHNEAGNRPRQEVFRCLKCGHPDNADANAAENIRCQGLMILTRAGNLPGRATGSPMGNKRNTPPPGGAALHA